MPADVPGDAEPWLAAAAAAPEPARRPQEGPPRPWNYADFMLGASYWDHLGDLDPTGVAPVPGMFEDFDRWGFAFDFGYDRVIHRGESWDLTLGIETGWSTFDNDGSGLTSPYSDLFANLYYLTPTVRWMAHVTPEVTITPGIGAGYYGFDISESETYYYGWWWEYDQRTLNQDGVFGGFASLSVDFHFDPGVAIRCENKVHFVHFSGLGSLYPQENSVDGPVWTFEIGFLLGF